MSAHPTPVFESRLPRVGTTIFTVMSALAQQHGAVNLGQGFPDFDCDPALVNHVADAMRDGLNQYPPMTGVPQLRQAVAEKIERLYGRRYDANSEITVTAGATQAILTAVLCCVHPGDEVIVLEPCYDSYAPNIELAGGKVVKAGWNGGYGRMVEFRRVFKRTLKTVLSQYPAARIELDSRGMMLRHSPPPVKGRLALISAG